MALPMVTRWGVHDVAAFPTDTHLDGPGLNHARFRTCLTMTLPDPTRPVPIEDSSRCDRRPAKSHAPMLRAVVTFVAEPRRRDFSDSPLVRLHAQSRTEIESPRARGPYTAGCEFSPATVLRAATLQLKPKRCLSAYGVGKSFECRFPPQQPPPAIAPRKCPCPLASRNDANAEPRQAHRWRIGPVPLFC